MTILVTKWFGVFLCDEKSGKIVDKMLMPKDAALVSSKLAEVQRGGLLNEERELAAKVEGKLAVSDRRQSELGKPELFDSSSITPDRFGFDQEFMHEVMLGLGKLRTSEPIPRDRNLVQAIRYLDDQIATINLYNERLHEWYGMHFPELADYAHDDRYATLIARNGEREGVIEELGIELESIGADMDPDDMDAIRDLADTLSRLYEDKERTETYIEGIVSDACPNMCALISAPLAARMVSLAGGLERLASLPSSTVQLLGAEKAMFRHLKSGKKGPKHGVIYQHPDIHRAPYWQRGKIARALAGKISIAAKVDQYHGEFVGDDLNSDFAKRVEEIKRKYPDPPKKPQKGKKPKGRNNNRRPRGH